MGADRRCQGVGAAQDRPPVGVFHPSVVVAAHPAKLGDRGRFAAGDGRDWLRHPLFLTSSARDVIPPAWQGSFERAALERSAFNSLQEAVAVASDGLTFELIEEFAYLSGIKPTTGAKIFTDHGGEAITVLCKATGLPKAAIGPLWRGMRRPEVDERG